jgi:hypothetical protein
MGFDAEVSKTLFEGLMRLADHDSRPEVLTSDLGRALSRVETATINVEAWLGLRYGLARLGLFEASGKARAGARSAALLAVANESRGGPSVVHALRAAMDKGDFELAESLVQRLPRRLEHHPLIASTSWFLDLCTGGSRSSQTAGGLQPSGSEEAFAKLVRGRSVALVGPAPMEESHGPAIDGHDLVIRMNYWGPRQLGDPELVGGRTDISYYNGQITGLLRKVDDTRFLDAMKFVVLREGGRGDPGGSVRCLQPIGRLGFAGQYQFLPLTLGDILRYRPSGVSVFGVNFMLSPSKYRDGYRQDGWPGIGDQRRSFAVHDLLDQFHFAQHLQSAGLVVLDETAARIASLSDEAYLAGIDGIYGRAAAHLS